ncbi:hypothetical protein DFJ73DRAFT_948228 [Zopfochytrium polystomum]|nr:hypothetical protein DFJ73DRAFT_948228 [Zopfochytrium polystomum]
MKQIIQQTPPPPLPGVSSPPFVSPRTSSVSSNASATMASNVYPSTSPFNPPASAFASSAVTPSASSHPLSPPVASVPTFTRESFARVMVDPDLLPDFVSFVELEHCFENILFYGDLMALEDRAASLIPFLTPESSAVYMAARSAGSSHALARFLRTNLPPAVSNLPASAAASAPGGPPRAHSSSVSPLVATLSSLPPLPPAYPVPPQLLSAYRDLYEKFLVHGTLLEINVPDSIRSRVVRAIADLGNANTVLATLTMFDDVADEVLRTLYTDSFQRFVTWRRNGGSVGKQQRQSKSRDSDAGTVASDSSEGRRRTRSGRQNLPPPEPTEEDQLADLVGSMSTAEAAFFFAMAAENNGAFFTDDGGSSTSFGDDDEAGKQAKKRNMKLRLMKGFGSNATGTGGPSSAPVLLDTRTSTGSSGPPPPLQPYSAGAAGSPSLSSKKLLWRRKPGSSGAGAGGASGNWTFEEVAGGSGALGVPSMTPPPAYTSDFGAAGPSSNGDVLRHQYPQMPTTFQGQASARSSPHPSFFSSASQPPQSFNPHQLSSSNSNQDPNSLAEAGLAGSGSLGSRSLTAGSLPNHRPLGNAAAVEYAPGLAGGGPRRMSSGALLGSGGNAAGAGSRGG